MEKIICVFKLVAMKLMMLFKFRGRVRIGFTGSLCGIPTVEVDRKSKVEISPHCRIEKSYIAAVAGGRVMVGEKSSLGKNCSLAPNICIYDHDHNFGNNGKERGFKIGKVQIGDNVWLGAGVIILRDTQIGDNCVVGAGTVVKEIIPPDSIVTGNRDLIIKKLK